MNDKSNYKSLNAIFNPPGSQLRIAQLRMLTLLEFLDDICNKNGLIYWLDSGTLLGAARHKGFIPWDDDIDVCMPRKDATRLKQIMRSKIHANHIVLQTPETDKYYKNTSWITLRDIKSKYLQDLFLHQQLTYQGLQIDIFIVDEGILPPLKKLFSFFQYQCVIKPILYRGSIFRRTISAISFQLIHYILEPILRRIKFNDSLDIGYGPTYSNKVNKTVIFPLSKLEFEGRLFNVPNDYDKYLTNFYGDWKTIPNPSEIKTHNASFEINNLV